MLIQHGLKKCFAFESMANLISVENAAAELKCSEQYVRSMIRSNRLAAERVGRTWVIPEDAVEIFKDQTEHSKIIDHERLDKSSKDGVIALSFFTGAMGLDLGLEMAGIKILLASEIDAPTRETIALNRPGIGLIGDIREYPADEIRHLAGLGEDDDIDLIVGGPPCQSFSTAGKRHGFEDERGSVLLTFVERILALHPKYAVIENVRGLLSAPLSHKPHDKRGYDFSPIAMNEERGGALLYLLSKLRDGGYGVSFNLYNAANFGAPQKRERVVIVCSRDGRKLPYLAPTRSENGEFGLPKWKTVREALEGLPKTGHDFVKFPEKRLRFYRMLKPGQYWKDLPEKYHKEALGGAYSSGGGKTGFLRRLPWDEPSYTLVTHPAMPATDLAHPVEDRPLSIQEYKRIQEFPDDWKVAGTIIDQYRQIGNAVPVSLGEAIGKLIVADMKQQYISNPPDFPYSRYRFTDEESWEQQVLGFKTIVTNGPNQMQLSFEER
jgi:DNA (cytosine-5)-methyltransferase 1